MARAFPGVLRVVALLVAQGCQPSASSPPEAVPVDAGVRDRACLAESHPILVHSIRVLRSRLMALDTSGQNGVFLGEGEVVYGSVWAPDGRSIAFRRRVISYLDDLVPTDLGLLSPTLQAGFSPEVVLLVDSSPNANGVTERRRDAPSWSPDGGELAFASLRDSDHWRIWTIARSGGRLRLAFPELEGVAHFYPAWSPRDAGRIAYVTETDAQRDLWITELGTGGKSQNLTHGRVAQIESPRWSPDGERLAFSGAPVEQAEVEPDRRDIYVVQVASLELTRMTSEGENVAAVWAPDGASLLITSASSAGDAARLQPQNVVRLPIDGGGHPEFLTEFASSAASDWYPYRECPD